MVAKRKIIYHIHTRASECFTFAKGEHFTLRSNSSRRMKSVSSHPLPLPFSKKAEYFAAPLSRRATGATASGQGALSHSRTGFVKAAARAWTHVLNRADVRRQGSREQARTPRITKRPWWIRHPERGGRRWWRHQELSPDP